jgi:hypothetical protein
MRSKNELNSVLGITAASFFAKKDKADSPSFAF